MAVCDVCNKPGNGSLVGAEQMREAVLGKKFNPFALGLSTGSPVYLMMGPAAYEYWKSQIVAQDTSDWNICPYCMKTLEPYLSAMPKASGVSTAITGRPRPYMYGTTAPLAVRQDGNGGLSFFSGHSSTAFGLVTSTFVTLHRLPPHARWPWYALAASTALTFPRDAPIGVRLQASLAASLDRPRFEIEDLAHVHRVPQFIPDLAALIVITP